MKLSRNLNVRSRRSMKGGRPRECPPLNMTDCGKNQNCSWSSKTNKCSKKRVSKAKSVKPVVAQAQAPAPVKKSVKKPKAVQAPVKKSVKKPKAVQAPVKKSVAAPAEKPSATKKPYQAKFIEIDPDNMVKHSQMSKKINEYLKDKKNKVNIGDILYVETDQDRQEYNFHIVLPKGKAVCLGEGWGMGWSAGGIIDQKDILHQYNVKYDDILAKESGNFYFDAHFRGEHARMEQEIKDEFRKNDLLS